MCEAQAAAGVLLIVVVTQETAVMPEKIHTERKTSVKEPRLHKGQFNVGSLRAELRPQLQLLAPTREIGPTGDIKISL